MFHIPFIPSSASATVAATATPTGQYTDLSVYGMDHNEYIDLNNIEPSLFPPSVAPCAYGTSLPNQSTWIPVAKPQISQISAKLAAAAAAAAAQQERPKCGGGGTSGSGSGGGGGRANGTGPKTVRRKKAKKDPNEPQKPVSAYALFFRDTQAAIKGRSPNATFGEVSKIVASMWDSLDFNAKNSYKQKTESAKREYLKRLAAYRASQLQSQDNNNVNNSNTSNTNTTNNGCSNISSSSSTSTSSSMDPRDNSRLLCVSSPYEQQQQQLPTTTNTQQQIQDMSLINPITIANSKQYFNPATTLTNFTMPERHVDYIGNEWNINTRCVMVQQPQTLATNFG